MQIEYGGHDIPLDLQVLSSIYRQKRIKVNFKSKRITVQCVSIISTLFMKINNQLIPTYRIYKIFWLIFWSYFVAFLGNSILINRPKYKPISIQWARCRSQLYIYVILVCYLSTIACLPSVNNWKPWLVRYCAHCHTLDLDVRFGFGLVRHPCHILDIQVPVVYVSYLSVYWISKLQLDVQLDIQPNIEYPARQSTRY